MVDPTILTTEMAISFLIAVFFSIFYEGAEPNGYGIWYGIMAGLSWFGLGGIMLIYNVTEIYAFGLLFAMIGVVYIIRTLGDMMSRMDPRRMTMDEDFR